MITSKNYLEIKEKRDLRICWIFLLLFKIFLLNSLELINEFTSISIKNLLELINEFQMYLIKEL
jgi:hypothetical protein